MISESRSIDYVEIHGISDIPSLEVTFEVTADISSIDDTQIQHFPPTTGESLKTDFEPVELAQVSESRSIAYVEIHGISDIPSSDTFEVTADISLIDDTQIQHFPPTTGEFLKTDFESVELATAMSRMPPASMEIPVSLVYRLALMDMDFLEEFSRTAASSDELAAWLGNAVRVGLLNLTCDLLSLFSHLIRKSSHNVPLLKRIIGEQENFLPHLLESPGPELRAATCTLTGNLARHGERPSPTVLKGLLECLSDCDGRVRRTAAFAVGNCAFHRDQEALCTSWVSLATMKVLYLLREPQGKTRAHAASALGNLGSISIQDHTHLLQLKVPQLLLHAACSDPEESVRLASLIALRSLGAASEIHQHLLTLNAMEKLSASLETEDASLKPVTASCAHHSKMLLQALGLTRDAMQEKGLCTD